RVNEDPDFHVYMSVEEDNRKIENSIREEMIEKGLKEGMKKGMEKGIEQGLKQGLEQGLEKGLEQGLEQAKLEKERIVLSMLEQGLDVNTISKYTKLDLDFIKKCQENNSNS
ncbi:MAG TPA: hypothetical protein IAB35_04525, partial [Candidatus Faecimonas gallistercoris]|nr:hypothetical protein [Candidatus Faecimonas gallistercoris]